MDGGGGRKERERDGKEEKIIWKKEENFFLFFFILSSMFSYHQRDHVNLGLIIEAFFTLIIIIVAIIRQMQETSTISLKSTSCRLNLLFYKLKALLCIIIIIIL